jgi:hypothetical protein
MDPDRDPGGPKTCGFGGSGSESGSGTMANTILQYTDIIKYVRYSLKQSCGTGCGFYGFIHRWLLAKCEEGFFDSDPGPG